MALTDEVQSRFSSQILINVTNPQNSAATTVDTTRLGNASTDVQADFQIEAGIAYDNTVATHVNVAVDGVYAKLLIRAGQGGKAEHDEYIERLRALKLITGRDRISPSTDSLLSPSTDVIGALPSFDRKNFAGFIPSPPARPTTSTDVTMPP
jgi:hypothetical protein